MLGRVRLGQLQRLSERVDVADRDVLVPCDESADGRAQLAVEAEQDRLALGAVLSLGQQVGGAASRGCRPVGDQDDLARPGGRSIPTWLDTSSFAAVTQLLPGPTILSTGAIVSVPYASAATAWAPPTA